MWIKRVIGFDICRDGGTLVAQYAGYRGRQYSLEFPIARKPIVKDGKVIDMECLGYEAPILTIYTPSVYKSPVTGIATPKMLQEKKMVSWVYAVKTLKKLRPLMRKSVVERENIYLRMVEVASCSGVMPN